jgi:predicted DCC family thiol-disulfide oxidoreductase YuxK
MPRAKSRPVLLYDTGCRLCRAAARLVVALDHSEALGLVGLGDEPAAALLEQVPEENRLLSVRLVLPDGELLSGGDAVLETLARLPATRPLAVLAHALHAQSAMERLYKLVARHRDRFGGIVSDGPAPRRCP